MDLLTVTQLKKKNPLLLQEWTGVGYLIAAVNSCALLPLKWADILPDIPASAQIT